MRLPPFVRTLSAAAGTALLAGAVWAQDQAEQAVATTVDGLPIIGQPVPNGINLKTRRDPWLIRQRHGLRGGDYLLFVGRLVPEKRPDLLLEAFAGVETDQRLVVVGGSSYTDDYVAELERLAARDPRVIMPGYVYGAELDEMFSNAAGFVQPSALEGLPLTLLEAMGSGLPVVVSDIEPHLEVVGTEHAGARVFAEGDVESLRGALRRLLADAAPSDAAAAQREQTLATYDWAACVDALEEIYFSAVRPGKRPQQQITVAPPVLEPHEIVLPRPAVPELEQLARTYSA